MIKCGNEMYMCGNVMKGRRKVGVKGIIIKDSKLLLKIYVFFV